LDGGERYWVHKCKGLLEASKQPRAAGHKKPREMQPHFSQDLEHQIISATRNIQKSRVEGEWNHLGECIARVFACDRPTDTTSLRSHKMLVRQGHSSDPQPANAFWRLQPSESLTRWSLFRLPSVRLLFVHGTSIQRSIRVACNQIINFSLDQIRRNS